MPLEKQKVARNSRNQPLNMLGLMREEERKEEQSTFIIEKR